jgi:PPOX class probable F420-dependent enzyme
MSASIPEKFNERIEKSEFVWFTTVREDGTPQPTPVWFIRDGDTFLIFTPPDSHKMSNLRSNPKVALGWADDTASEYVVVMGEAKFDDSTPPANQVPAYMEKYTQGIKDIGMTPESFSKRFSQPIRVTPTHVRGE